MPDERLDRAIEEVARRMTEGAPADGAAFRRGVLARIDAGDAPRRSWRAAFVLSPIAAAIVIAVAAFMMRGWPQPAAPLTIANQAGQGQPQHEPSGAAGRDAAPSPQTNSNGQPLPAAATNARRRPARPVPDIGESGIVEPALPVDSIAVTPLAVDTMPTDPIQIEKLETIAPITVAPLDTIDASRRNP